MAYYQTMDFSSPLNGLMRPLDASIVSALARTEDGLTGRRIEALVGSRSRSALAAAFERLQLLGLIDRTDIGSAGVYRLNRSHLFWEPIERVILAGPAKIEGEIAGYLSRRYGDAVTAALFGSVARRRSGLASDLDLAVVFHEHADPDLNRRSERLVTLAERMRARTGNPIQIVDIDVQGLRRMVASADPLIESWFEDSVTIHGRDLRAMIREAKTT